MKILGIGNAIVDVICKVDDDFISKKEQTSNQKLCDIRKVFDKYNLISGLHTFYSEKNKIYKNILPPLSLLSDIEKKDLKENLSNLNFSLSTSMAA